MFQADEARMNSEISFRQLSSMADLTATVDVQKAVWRMRDVEVASPHTLKAIVHSGGAVIGAEAEGRLLGFCAGFAALRAGQLMLWSHMACVHPDCQRRGIGLRLKQEQRKWALGAGFRLMAWTFDPLQSANANFNFNRLGVVARRYSADHYGRMQDSINAGLASDRLEAQWELNSPRVVAMALPQLPAEQAIFPVGLTMLLREERGGLQYRKPVIGGGERFGLEIPADIADLKRRDIERAKQWQRYLRAAMTELLWADYFVSAFIRQDDRACYVLSPSD